MPDSDSEKDKSLCSWIVMCGIMYLASIIYTYNRHLKIFGYIILIFVFAVSWMFIAKDSADYLKGFANTGIYNYLTNIITNNNIFIYFVYAICLTIIILNSYGIVTVLKTYYDRMTQVKSFDLNLSQMQRDNLFTFNTAFYISTLSLLGLIFSLSFWKDDVPATPPKITFKDLELISYAQIFVFIISLIASFILVDYSTRFKRAKHDSLPTKNQKRIASSNRKIKGQNNFFNSFTRLAKTQNNKTSSGGQDLLQNTSQLTPIKLSEINQADNITIQSYQNLVIPVGKTLTIASGKTLTNNGAITNNGTIKNNGTYSGTKPSPVGTIAGTNAVQIS